ncbi:MAG: 7-cyano-7-deazaguanine synthase QueC [Candidatus Omnitrophota bacterium]|nr:7-cyano-7-deazaguanine synthase QueC [Candidatus Omnitrophota bacterium]
MPVTRGKKGLPAGRQAIVLLSGGLDSATTLYIAKKQGYKCLCLIFDYGQRHKKEILLAKSIAKSAGCRYRIVKFRLPWKGSALLDKAVTLPYHRSLDSESFKEKIPSTYVPARNIVFLSFATSFAEAVGAGAIFIGANVVDYSGYPDCRPEFFADFAETIKIGTKSGVEGRSIKIFAPLIHKSKKEIIKTGICLGVPYHLTWSCYEGGRKPCHKCDSCKLREKGFKELGIKDPLDG